MKQDNPNKNDAASIPAQNPSKPMDSKKEVEQSPDAKTDQDYPGYPHYPAKEDMMGQDSGAQREDLDVENLPNQNRGGVSQRYLAGQDTDRAAEAMIPGPATDDELDIKMGTDGDVTEDDLAGLRSMDDDMGDVRAVSLDDQNTDLDVPGSELDDNDEAMGEEDEENNYYSLGGDRQDHNEEDPYSGPVRGNDV